MPSPFGEGQTDTPINRLYVGEVLHPSVFSLSAPQLGQNAERLTQCSVITRTSPRWARIILRNFNGQIQVHLSIY